MTYHDTIARYRECLDPLRDGKGFDLIHTSIRTVHQYVHQTHPWAWHQKRLTESADNSERRLKHANELRGISLLTTKRIWCTSEPLEQA